ncbi:MAG: hypothetical protein Fur0012_06340 [Elusimicrobiota bacterium]
MPKTKIIATAGPVSFSKSVLRKIILNGVDVIRFNFSHASRSTSTEVIRTIRELNRSMKRAVKKLADLKGNRIRITGLKREIELKKNQVITIASLCYKGKADLIFDYPGNFSALKPRHPVFIEDGRIELEILSVSGKSFSARTVIGGLLKNGKGVNFPESRLDFPSLNGEDEEDLVFACKHGFEYIAQSFVRNAKDIMTIRQIANRMGSKAKIIAKIENAEALENIDEIIEASDGIMVARGDLGISVPFYKVPLIQKNLILRAAEKNKFSIVATQMLESMIENYRPTRAEVSDVANAVFDGANFVMLSGETASGHYPAESVKAMNEILKYCEPYLPVYGRKKI